MPLRYKLAGDDFEHLVCGGTIELSEQIQIALGEIGFLEMQNTVFLAEEEHPRTGFTKRVGKTGTAGEQQHYGPTPTVEEPLD